MHMATVVTSELRHGDVVHCHGMRCLVDGPINRRENHRPQYGPGDWAVHWTKALVLNPEEVTDSLLRSFIRPDNVWSKEERQWIVPEGDPRWSIQGNDNARWYVERTG